MLATTNRNLQAEVAAGRFREDLYFRLAVVPLRVPPLRERREDIPELVDYFFARCAKRLGRDPCSLEASAEQLLLDYHWPGNVRELENIVTRASILHAGRPIAADDLRRWLIADPEETQIARRERAGGNQFAGDGTQTDRSHAGKIRRASGENGRGAGHRTANPFGQVATIRLCPA